MSAEMWFGTDGRGEKGKQPPEQQSPVPVRVHSLTKAPGIEIREHVERLVRENAERQRRERATLKGNLSTPVADLGEGSEEDVLANASTLFLGNVAATLVGYVAGDRRNQPFARFGSPPEWAVNDAAGANLSFFEEDWGTPPIRVSRDRRYRPFEEDHGTAEDAVVRGRRH
jgi:hypothetical protein